MSPQRAEAIRPCDHRPTVDLSTRRRIQKVTEEEEEEDARMKLMVGSHHHETSLKAARQ